MSQHDYNIANQTALSFRGDLNDALTAIASTNSGTSAPTTTYANMFWYDTTNNILKIRNEGNSSWIKAGYLDQTAGEFHPFAGANKIEAFLDEDTLASNSATAAPSQQSVKAYVDNTIGEIVNSFEFIEEYIADGSSSYANFTGFDNSRYSSYIFKMRNIRASATNRKFSLQTSGNGGTSYSTGSTDYHDSFDLGKDMINLTSEVLYGNGYDGVSGEVCVFPSDGSVQSYVTSNLAYVGSSAMITSNNGGVRRFDTPVNAVRFFHDSISALSTGSITMYGLTGDV